MDRIVILEKSNITENKLYELYNLYNEKYFDSSLPKASLDNGDIKIYIVNKNASYYGKCAKEGWIKINAYNMNTSYNIEVKNTLIHEMIHTMQFSLGYKSGHGISFKNKANEINKDGWNIKVHVDIKLEKLIKDIENICNNDLKDIWNELSKLKYRRQTSTLYYINLIKEILDFNNIKYSDDNISELEKNINNIRYMEETNELTDIINIIKNDDNIKESDWSLYKEWKDNKAIWNLDKEGDKTKLAECFENIVGFIENYPTLKGQVRFNDVRDYVEIFGHQMGDADIHMVLNLITAKFIPTFSKLKMVKDALDNVAFKNKYNFIKEWLEKNHEENYDDSKDFLEILIKDILRCEELDKYYKLYYEELKIHLMATVRKNCFAKYEADYKYDNILVFTSEEGGSGKTSSIENIFIFDNKSYGLVIDPESVNFNDKDFIMSCHQYAGVVFDEIKVNRSKVNALKTFIQKKKDNYRKPYAYCADDQWRLFSMWGTSNNTDFLKDYTTNYERRWLIIHIAEDRQNGVRTNKMLQANDYEFVKKLWAQIYHTYIQNPEIELWINEEYEPILTQLQRNYKASNNADYNTIIDDLLEREYGFVFANEVDVDYIVQQYRHGNTYDWCKRHNEEMDEKYKRSKEGTYILKPDEKKIQYWGKINRIPKTRLYEILSKLGFEYTKPTFNAEMRDSGRWNGYKEGNRQCRINGISYNAYWRVQEIDLQQFSDQIGLY